MDVAIYISISILITVLLLLLTLLAKSFTRKPATAAAEAVVPERAAPRPAAGRGGAAPRAQGGVRRGGPRRRMVRDRNRDDDEENFRDYSDDDDSDTTADIFDAIAQPDGKIGAKKMKKLQDKAEKKANREAAEQERVDRKERETEREALRKKDDAKRKVEEAAVEEEERVKKEEQERKEHEEYLAMKAMFSVDDEGENDLETDLSSESLLQEFISYVKDMKVVILEDLAAHFKIKTQDAIDRIMTLQETGDLTGVIDDRGKFIYITIDELQSVAKFICQRGRVAITELAESSNRLINLNPDNVDTTRRLYTQVTST